jgi:hypothetical protein
MKMPCIFAPAIESCICSFTYKEVKRQFKIRKQDNGVNEYFAHKLL